MCLSKIAAITTFVTPLLCFAMFGQTSDPIPPHTFHVQGTIKDQTGAVIPGVKVDFHCKKFDNPFDKTVATDKVGFYETFLPFGECTMAAQRPGFEVYSQPPFRAMSPKNLTFDVTLLVGGSFWQPIDAPIPPQMFRVKGTVKDAAGDAIYRARVVFRSEQVNKTVLTDAAGAYQLDLPLADYTMTTQSLGFRPYRRPLFRPTSSVTLSFDVTLLPFASCDVLVWNSSGKVTPEEWASAQKDTCLREEVLSVESQGVPYQLSIRYGTRATNGRTYSYSDEETNQNEIPVFVAYNLFSLQAEQVVYDAKLWLIKAQGNVIVNEPHSTQRSDSLAFKIGNGQAISTTRLRMFHVKGKMMSPTGTLLPGVKITFQSKEFDKTVTTNDIGAYEVDLPLGDYTMTAQTRSIKFERRPAFRVTSPKRLTFDITMPVPTDNRESKDPVLVLPLVR